jgi:hypothetical protein
LLPHTLHALLVADGSEPHARGGHGSVSDGHDSGRGAKNNKGEGSNKSKAAKAKAAV